MRNLPVILIGTSQMSVDYANVLLRQNVDFIVVGRSEKSCQAFRSQTGIKPIAGGIEHFLLTNPSPLTAIVAVNIENLYEISSLLLAHGCKKS